MRYSLETDDENRPPKTDADFWNAGHWHLGALHNVARASYCLLSPEQLCWAYVILLRCTKTQAVAVLSSIFAITTKFSRSCLLRTQKASCRWRIL